MQLPELNQEEAMSDFCKANNLSEEKRAKLQMVVNDQLKIYFAKRRQNHSMAISGKLWNSNRYLS